MTAEVKQAFPAWKDATDWAKHLDRVARGKGPKPVLPRDRDNPNTAEYDELQRMSASPWGYVISEQMSQALMVEGHHPGVKPEDGQKVGNSPAWDNHWQPNRLDAGQTPIYQDTFVTGACYGLALPGKDPLTGGARTVMRGKTSKEMVAFYDDDLDDEFPSFGLSGVEQKGEKGEAGFAMRYYDDNFWYTFWADEEGEKVEFTGEAFPHLAGRPPIVRFAHRPDLQGGTLSEIEPLLPVLARIDQDGFDRLVVQRFGAWVIRWVSGLKKPANATEQAEKELALRVSSLLVSDSPDTKFGSIPGTSLQWYIEAREHDMRDLAALSQVPPHWLTGAMVNLSAEALAAAEAAFMRKIDLCKHMFGESWELWLRLAAKMSGLPGVTDYNAQMQWKDTESRSLVQAATALGILAKQLQVPVEMLWGKIPGWTDQMTTEAKKIMRDGEWVSLMRSMGLNPDGSPLQAAGPLDLGPKPALRVS